MERPNAYRISPNGVELEALFHLSPDPIAVFGPDGAIRCANAAMVAATGFSQAELISKPFRNIIYQEDFPLIEPALESPEAVRNRFPIEARCAAKSGKLLWHEWRIAPAGDNGFIALGREITARKSKHPEISTQDTDELANCSGFWVRDAAGVVRCDSAKEAAIDVVCAHASSSVTTDPGVADWVLRQREHHFATLAKAAPVGIFQADLDGHCRYVNGRYLEITGYGCEEIRGVYWWEHAVPEDRDRVKEQWQETIAGQGRFELEYRLRRKDGRIIWVLNQAAPEPDTEGETLGYIGSITDINQGKLNEIELRNYREHLEDMVRERTLELEAVNRELESFSYSVSHDLRAPLRAINGFNNALLEEYGDKLDEDGLFYLRRMQANTRQMAQLVEDLMELSKVTQQELRREWVDLSAMAETILGELRLAEPDRQAETIIMPGLKVYGDSHLLGIMMQNMLGNAWKYTGRTAQTRIEFGAIENEGARTFFIRDNGVGFDIACAPHLFRAFQRLHDSSQFEGTGIGLATVERIVCRHGGEVWAESEEGKGATFFFVLY